jgi:3-dehydroquinate synthase
MQPPRHVAAVRHALIPAAGRGARLDRPGTPKPLTTIGGVPLIVRLLKQLESAGVEESLVVIGYEAPVMSRALTHHPELARAPALLHERGWEAGMGTSLLSARGRIDGPFVLAMADHVFDDRLVARMVGQQVAPDEIVLLADTHLGQLFDVENAVKLTLAGDQVTAIGRELSRFDAVDTGLFVCGSALFDALERARQRRPDADLLDAVALMAEAGRARVVYTDGLAWDDIDTPAAAIHCEMRLRRAQRVSAVKVPSVPGRRPNASRYSFETGAPTTTELVVGRGLASDPERLNLGIPPESASSPLFVFTDTTVNRLYGDRVVGALEAQGYPVHRIVLPDGEQAKTLPSFAGLVERVLAEGIDEHSILVSLGGGAVCNVCGFVASTLYRGIGLIHVPTTLMAQCDAAISHKQALNGARGKNLVGSYYAPIRVVVDVDFLATLEDWMIPDGLAEAVKHAIGQDRAYYDRLLAYDGDIRDPEFLEYVVKKNIELKCSIMKTDPKEHHDGMVLQYGHNVGHAVEYLSGYELSHGESVAIGMMVSARVSRLLGGARDELVAQHERLLGKYGLPTHIPAEMRISDIMEALRYDKKFVSEGVRMGLVGELGTMWAVGGEYAIPVGEDVLVPALEASMAGAA